MAALAPGKIQYTCFPNEEGGIVDDLLVYQYEPEKYMLVVNAANIEKDWNWSCFSQYGGGRIGKLFGQHSSTRCTGSEGCSGSAKVDRH